jgi:hypothetical protein
MGATAAIITSMGLIAGLTHGDNAKTGIITGLLIVAIADNISDSLGIHIYKESEGASRRDINSFTYGNFVVRLFFAFTFILIVLLLPCICRSCCFFPLGLDFTRCLKLFNCKK